MIFSAVALLVILMVFIGMLTVGEQWILRAEAQTAADAAALAGVSALQRQEVTVSWWTDHYSDWCDATGNGDWYPCGHYREYHGRDVVSHYQLDDSSSAQTTVLRAVEDLLARNASQGATFTMPNYLGPFVDNGLICSPSAVLPVTIHARKPKMFPGFFSGDTHEVNVRAEATRLTPIDDVIECLRSRDTIPYEHLVP